MRTFDDLSLELIKNIIDYIPEEKRQVSTDGRKPVEELIYDFLAKFGWALEDSSQSHLSRIAQTSTKYYNLLTPRFHRYVQFPPAKPSHMPNNRKDLAHAW
jgi:hypothetical protein